VARWIPFFVLSVMIHLVVILIPFNYGSTELVDPRVISVEIETFSKPSGETGSPGSETAPLPKKVPVKTGAIEKQLQPEAAFSRSDPVVAGEPLDDEEPEPKIVAPGDGVKPSGGSATPVVTEADTIRRVTPVYPLASRRRGEEGEVRLLVGVARDGSTASVEVVGTSGFSALDEAAVFAVRRWRFAPGSPEKLIVPVIFRLE